MHNPIFDAVVFGMIVAGYVIGRWADPRRRARRALDKVGSSSIRELQEGERAHVAGIVGARGATMVSPVGQHPCIGFRLLVQSLESGAKEDTWRSVLKRAACDPFWIKDETGEAVVDGPFFIGLDPDDAAWAGLPSALYSLLEEAKVPMTGMFGRDKQFRFSEAILKAGDRIAVLGRAFYESDPTGASAVLRAPAMSWHLKGSAKEPVILADVEDPEALDDESPVRSNDG